MPNRLSRVTAILAKIETTVGTDSVPSGGANAMLVAEVDVRPIVANNVNRDRLRSFIGGNPALVGPIYKQVSFNVELVGSGTAGTAPAWGPLLRACAWAETIIAGTRVDYTPVTGNQETVTIYAFKDGVRHVLLGAKGDWQINLRTGQLPTISFTFTGLDGSESAVANPALTLSGFRQPQIPQDAFTQDLVIGGTVSPTGAPAITGGTAVVSDGLQLQGNQSVPFVPLIGQQSIDVNARDVTGSLMLDETAANEISRLGAVRANTLQAFSILHGTVAGDRVLVHLPSGQLTDPAYDDMQGKLVNRYGLRAVPVSGNDEVRLVTSF